MPHLEGHVPVSGVNPNILKTSGPILKTFYKYMYVHIKNIILRFQLPCFKVKVHDSDKRLHILGVHHTAFHINETICKAKVSTCFIFRKFVK